ncbi:MAG: hemerythrin domain-containing protein [Burkholderiales bacterium]|nr:hemerythrin domain-containing protein [Burkholderiales bacterium]
MCAVPVPGFDRPLELILQVHRRIEHRCALMGRLVEHLAERGCDADARATAGHIVRFFDEDVARHHEDEELEFYDAVVAAAPAPDRARVAALVARLRSEHAELQSLWADALRPQLVAVQQGRVAWFGGSEIERCHSLYIEHTTRENDELLPLAEAFLTSAQLEQLGRGMAARRGRPYP